MQPRTQECFRRFHRHRRRSAGIFLAVGSGALAVAAWGSAAFVLGPAATTRVVEQDRSSVATAAGGLAVLLFRPGAAVAALPPLEDLPLAALQGLRGNVIDADGFKVGVPEDTWQAVGTSVPVFLIGIPLCLFPVMFAVSWALTWVTQTKPFDSKLTTYLGAGTMPPEGFTNPLDVRLNEREPRGRRDDDGGGGTSPYEAYKKAQAEGKSAGGTKGIV
mmetsp:Transcript_50314/g.144719  ORF Transcript_50314/g.144719 Transcript_50314/m.144719 type:complete len:218 (+) Transcript_50314:67-720(+)